jgi:hypothetical protein
MANNKAKGSEWERKLCKFLTVWATGNEKPYVFWRTPGSGSFVTNKVSTDASGDIISILPEGRFFTDIISCEAKIGYEDTDLFKHFKLNKNNTIETFWAQCIRDSRTANKYGMLIYKKKLYPSIVGIEADMVKLLVKQKLELPKSLTINFKNELPDMVMYDFETLFSIVLPINIMKIKQKAI